MAGSSSNSKPCSRCKAEDAPLKLRNGYSCGDCYITYVRNKVSKRLGFATLQTRISSKPAPRRFAVGLSFGPSSSALTCLLDEQARLQDSRKGTTPYEILVVHVDTDLGEKRQDGGDEDSPAQSLLKRYAEKFPVLEFQCVHLSKVLDVRTVDWSALPGLPDAEEGLSPSARLRGLFDKLPSMTAKADVLRLLIRHLLLHIAMEKSYNALFLGHTTTALAALTLSEVANGRGFSVPWQVNDGPFTMRTYTSPTDTTSVAQTEFAIHYPLREIFKNEVNMYISLSAPLKDLGLGGEDAAKRENVVSHKDTSIEEIMTKYFEDAEGSYSGIVANVVRTTGKLDRMRGEVLCGLCGVTLDEQGDSRWAGELGDEEEEGQERKRLCYGCKRSVNG